MVVWTDAIKRVLGDHLSPAAADACFALLAAMRTTEEVLAGRLDDSVKQGVVQMLVDLTYGLQFNPFWQKAAPLVQPVFTASVVAWFDSMRYAERATNARTDAIRGDAGAKAFATKNTIFEVAMAVFLADKGPGAVARDGVRFRDALAGVKG
jgi:peptidoglycan hydrolase-like protein with peptidoglycan-binding domain